MKVEKEEHAKGRVRWRQMICRGDPHSKRWLKLIIDSTWTFITRSDVAARWWQPPSHFNLHSYFVNRVNQSVRLRLKSPNQQIWFHLTCFYTLFLLHVWFLEVKLRVIKFGLKRTTKSSFVPTKWSRWSWQRHGRTSRIAVSLCCKPQSSFFSAFAYFSFLTRRYLWKLILHWD